jgi:pyruvate ferredoxin oxidoreductase delta subunit
MKTAISSPTIGAMGKTGTWRVFRPIIDVEKCIKCWRCWIFCPDGVISRNDYPSIDLEYCKGCGICAHECPVDAIKMEREKK